jgi:hypothetical protein
MDTPETPEELLERVSDCSIRDFYPEFDNLEPVAQRVIQLLHSQLIQGDLSYRSMQSLIGFMLVVWRDMTIAAHRSVEASLSNSYGIQMRLLGEIFHYGRMRQYIDMLFASLQEFPTFPDTEDRHYKAVRDTASDEV